MAITKEDVLEFISNLSVLELSELVKEFEEKFLKELSNGKTITIPPRSTVIVSNQKKKA